MAEQEYDWKGYLNIADHLLKDEDLDEQTRCRVSVSRAYYAAFHIARDYLDKIKYSEKNYMVGGEHERVCNAFRHMNLGSKTHKDECSLIGGYLKTLKDARKAADYDDVWNFSIKQAQREYGKAEIIIKRIEALEM